MTLSTTTLRPSPWKVACTSSKSVLQLQTGMRCQLGGNTNLGFYMAIGNSIAYLCFSPFLLPSTRNKVDIRFLLYGGSNQLRAAVKKSQHLYHPLYVATTYHGFEGLYFHQGASPVRKSVSDQVEKTTLSSDPTSR